MEQVANGETGGGMDPASLQILLSRLRGIAEEMGAVLQRAGFSPNIKERADFSAAVFGADGQMLAQAEHLPVHLGSMPASVRAAIDAFSGGGGGGDGGVGQSLVPGDHVIVNDPFAGGTHLNDITLITPCFVDGEIIGWVANRAHHADVGGAAPGSLPAEATEIFQEGLRLPPVKLSGGVRAILAANSRTPTERWGDLDAQVGANVVGVRRLAALAGSCSSFSAVLDYGERRMRSVLSAVPDGSWNFADVMDSFGPHSHQQHATRVQLSMTIKGDGICFDFTGTDDQVEGNVNTVAAVTFSSVIFAVRSVLAPSVPANAGALRPITVIVPAGSLLDARPPAAVGAGNVEVSQRVADVCLGALAQVAPGAVGAASQGTMNNVLIGGAGSGRGEAWVYYETVGGGQGGRSFAAGMSGVHTAMTNTKNTPVEAFERAFPMRVLRQRLRRGSGGAGSAPGGEGVERDLQVLVDATVSLITERRVSQPWGLAGGESGAVGENWLLPGGDELRAERLPDKCTIQLKAGDVLRMLPPGGGGWGPAPSG